MLCLSRQVDEKIVITDKESGQRITVVVVDIRGDKVRIGCEASDKFQIDRGEVDEAKKESAGEI